MEIDVFEGQKRQGDFGRVVPFRSARDLSWKFPQSLESIGLAIDETRRVGVEKEQLRFQFYVTRTENYVYVCI